MSASSEKGRRVFVDSNIWLYAFIHTQDARKHVLAIEAIKHPEIVVSTQIISEVSVNLLKQTSFSESEIQGLVSAFYMRYQVTVIDKETFITASEVRNRYHLSYWGSMVVASALQSGSEVLFTEDMQHGLLIDGVLRIVNPFLAHEAS